MKKSFCAGIIWFNPDARAFTQLRIVSSCFEKVYVYDNSSVSSKSKVDKMKLDNIEYFFNKKNEGISIAFNKIVKKCRNSDFLFALDQDTEVSRENISDLQKYINQYFTKNVGIYCPYIYYDNKYKDEPKSVENISFTITSCSMLNLKIFKKMGGYDNNIFLDGVDREYCFRLIRQGYMIQQIGTIKVKQNLGNGRKNIFGIYEHSPIRNYYIAYNRLYFIDKYPDYFKNSRKIKYLYLSTIKQFLSVVLCEKQKLAKIHMIIKANKNYRLRRKNAN